MPGYMESSPAKSRYMQPLRSLASGAFSDHRAIMPTAGRVGHATLYLALLEREAGHRDLTKRAARVSVTSTTSTSTSCATASLYSSVTGTTCATTRPALTRLLTTLAGPPSVRQSSESASMAPCPHVASLKSGLAPYETKKEPSARSVAPSAAEASGITPRADRKSVV